MIWAWPYEEQYTNNDCAKARFHYALFMDGISLAPIGVLLLVACLIAMLSRRLGLPYIVGLVGAGFLIALLPNSPQVPLSRELIFNVLLPPLVFEAALQLEWKRFRAELPLTLTLAFIGVAIAAAVVAVGLHDLAGWSWIGAALFGVLIAATDPVSVIASFREMNVQPRVSMVVESESLLNDGVAAVGFCGPFRHRRGCIPTAGSVVPAFMWTLGGGLAIGLAVSAAILLIVGRTDDPLVEITLTTIAAYGSFLLAEHFGASGIISALATGLVIGSAGTRFSPVRAVIEFTGLGSTSPSSQTVWSSSSSERTSPTSLSTSSAHRGRSRLSWYWRGEACRCTRWRCSSGGRAGGSNHPYSTPCSGADSRRAGAGPRPRSPRECAGARRNHFDRVRGRGFLDPGPGPDHAVADQAARAGLQAGGCRGGGGP